MRYAEQCAQVVAPEEVAHFRIAQSAPSAPPKAVPCVSRSVWGRLGQGLAHRVEARPFVGQGATYRGRTGLAARLGLALLLGSAVAQKLAQLRPPQDPAR